MIHIDTVKLSENKKYAKMQTQCKIEGQGEIVIEEIKTLLNYCKQDDDLRKIVITAIAEVLHDN
jgi:hypothetical protein